MRGSRAAGVEVVVVGGGVAGGLAAARLAEAGRATLLVSKDPLVYSRMTLSYALRSGVTDPRKYAIYTPSELAALGVRFANDEVVAVEVGERRLYTRRSGVIEYDILVVATGARPRRPPIEGLEHRNVYAFLSIEDVDAISREASPGRRALVIGAGMIGLLAADSLVARGVKVYVVDILDYPALTVLEEEAAKRILDKMRAAGVTFYGGTSVEKLLGSRGRAERAVLDTGESLDIDFVVLAAGVEPNLPGGLEKLRRGPGGALLTDERLRTSRGDIYAIGDCSTTIDLLVQRPLYRPLGVLASYAASHLPRALEGVSYRGFYAIQSEEAFGLLFMRSGLSGAELRMLGLPYTKALVEYRVPGVGAMRSIVLAEKGRRARLLGWQNAATAMASYKSKLFEQAVREAWSLEELQEAGIRVVGEAPGRR